jgi:hypothetical protein
VRFCRLHGSLLAASVVVTAAALLWFSWEYSAFAVVKPLPRFRAMVPWTILLDLMLGIALSLMAYGTGRLQANVFRTIAKLLAGAVFFGAGVFLAEYLSGHTFGNLDHWWFQTNIAVVEDIFPGQPAPQTSIYFPVFCRCLLCLPPVFKPKNSGLTTRYR